MHEVTVEGYSSPSDDPVVARVDTALEIVKRVDRRERPVSLPSRLLAITTPFNVESICAGVMPPQSGEGAWEGCYETNMIPGLPVGKKSAASRARLDACTVCFACGEASPNPLSWSGGDGDEKNWRSGKGLIFPRDKTGAHGLGFFGPSMILDDSSRLTLAFFAHANMERMLGTRPYRLTPRQLDTLRWAAEGKTDQEIASLLGISGHTVDKYMRQCKEALNAANRTAAIVRAIRYGLIG